MNKKVVIFDFDGTLVDVEPLFIELYNKLSTEFGYERITPDEVPLLKKLGAKQFIRDKVKAPWWRLPGMMKRGRDEYKKSVERVNLFPEMKDVVGELEKRGYRIGILSSNTTDAIHALLTRFGMKVDFVYQSTLFGKASALKKALRQEGLSREEVMYIGDEIRDLEACRKAEIDILSATWGLNSKEALHNAGADTIDSPKEILARLS